MTTEIGWLIEQIAVGPSPASWFTGDGFSTDSLEAVRFTRREDAQKLLDRMLKRKEASAESWELFRVRLGADNFTVTEHQWGFPHEPRERPLDRLFYGGHDYLPTHKVNEQVMALQAEIQRLRSSEPDASQAEICTVTVKDGFPVGCRLKAPGLPDGDHDLFCVPHPGEPGALHPDTVRLNWLAPRYRSLRFHDETYPLYEGGAMVGLVSDADPDLRAALDRYAFPETKVTERSARRDVETGREMAGSENGQPPTKSGDA